MGNILVQSMATADIANVWELRQIVRDSVELHEYTPRDRDEWEEKYARFHELARVASR